MPYNLRKRKPVAEPEVKPEPKRKKVDTEPAAKRKKVEPKAPVAPKEKKVAVKKPTTTKKKEIKVKKQEEIEDEEEEEHRDENEVVKEEEQEQQMELDHEEVDKKEDKKIKDIELTATSQLIFGEDTCGELGQGDIGVTKKSPTNVSFDKSVSSVACGPVHTLTLTVDGQVYSYGCNDEGALGRVTDGDEKLESTPTIVSIDGKTTKITAGDSHSAALTCDGRVFAWGNFRDEHGPVGLTPECEGKSTLKPIQILPEVKLKDIASGSNHMLLLSVDGVVYSFGVGTQGQLGRMSAEEVGEGTECKPITAENRELFLKPHKVNLKNVDPQRPFVCDAIFAGNFSSFATNTDKKKNRLAAWGLNNYFQLGYKGAKNQLVQHVPKRSTFTCSTSMKRVACGPHHTLFLTKTGRVYSAGRNQYGMLGLAKSNGDEVCPAKNIDSLGNSIVDISAGINTSFAVSDDGSLFAWGMGGLSLGLKSEKDLTEPTKVESLADKKVLTVSTGGAFTSVLVKSP